MAISIFLPIYHGDFLVYKLQLASINNYFAMQDLKEIILVINEDSGDDFAQTYMRLTDLLQSFPDIFDKTKIYNAESLVENKSNLRGWSSQQVIKLRSYNVASSENILILDAKNHFIRSVSEEDFFEKGTNKPRLRISKQEEGMPHYQRAVASREVIDKSLQNIEFYTTPTITPYPIHKGLLEELEKFINKKGLSYNNLFIKEDGKESPTEFLLISAYVEYKFGSLDKYFSPGQYPITFFRSFPSKESISSRMLEEAKEKKSHTFSLHSGRIANLSDKEKKSILDIWLDNELISIDEGLAILNGTA